ncbi:histidinol-phosphate transaminase [bacterium]|nr:histidinol-phosphate transaminase [bacterium]
MKPLVTRNIEKLRPYQPGKPIEETKRELGLPDPVKMASNENPLGPSPKAIEAMKAACGEMHYYPDGGCYTLKEALAAHLAQYDIEPHNLIIGNGSNEIIEFVIRTFVAPNENIVTGEPSFIIYKLAGISHNRQEITVPLKPDMTYDMDAVACTVNEKTKVVFLANPNNPTGRIFSTREFERFLSHIRDDIVICIDEAYAEYVDDPDVPNGLEYAPYRNRLIVLRTFSKIYGLAGLRVGYGVSHRELIGYMDRVRPPFNVNRMAQAAALAALDDQEHIEKSIEINRKGRAFLQAEFERLQIKYYPSQTNFILADFEKPAAPLYQALLERGFITRPVENYNLPNCLRITVGTEDQNQRFVEALDAFIREQD